MAKTETGADLQTALRASADPAARETIEYLPFDLIDPDPNNFYSLDGLEKLADSIATVGLIDPIRVRPDGDRYTVTSGHRRRAAIKLLIDGGEDGWRDAVPCIVDRGQETPEWAALKLIFANSATRQRSSAEMSREAERVEELLVALREKGYSFPGRMQDHVAEAMNTKASKLKRLHAIRNNLCEDWLELFDRGELNESIAYTLSQQPFTVQQPTYVAIMREGGLSKCYFTASSVELIAENRKKLMELDCEISGRKCDCWAMRYEQSLTHRFASGGFGSCQWGRCCIACVQIESCLNSCLRAAQERKRWQEERAKEFERAEAARAELEDIYREAEASRTDGPAAISGGYRQTGLLFDRVQRIRRAAEASGADLRHVFSMRSLSERDLETYLSIINGGPDPNHELDELFDDTDELVDLADDLECSTDFLLGRSDEPFQKEEAKAELVQKTKAAAAPEWKKGNPPISGWYLTWSIWMDYRPDYEMLFWSGNQWTEGDRGRASKSTVLAWFRVPQKAGAPTGKEETP